MAPAPEAIYLESVRMSQTCQMHPHTTKHLFNCLESLTPLTVKDHWNNL